MLKREILLKKIVFAVLLGMAYYIFIRATGVTISCPIRFISGGRISCPGCGVTSMFIYLFNGRVRDAFFSNPCVFVLGILWLVFFVIVIVFQPKMFLKSNRILNILSYISITALLVFGAVRNILNWI